MLTDQIAAFGEGTIAGSEAGFSAALDNPCSPCEPAAAEDPVSSGIHESTE